MCFAQCPSVEQNGGGVDARKLGFNECTHCTKYILLGFAKLVVDDDRVELRSKTHFVLSFV